MRKFYGDNVLNCLIFKSTIRNHSSADNQPHVAIGVKRRPSALHGGKWLRHLES
jgi:hypothetical protein